MITHNSTCRYYFPSATNRCHCCHSQKIISSSRCPYDYSRSIPAGEILISIVTCYFIYFLYNTIKLCIIISFIFSIIYYIYKQMDIRSLILNIYPKKFDIPSTVFNETKSDENVNEDTSTNPDDDDEELHSSIKEDDQQSLLTETVSNSNSDINTETSNTFLELENPRDTMVKRTEKLRSNRNATTAPHQSRVRKIFIENSLQDQHVSTSNRLETSLQSSSSRSQAGYYGPMNTIMIETSHFLKDDKKQISSKLINSSKNSEEIEAESSMKMIIQSQVSADTSISSMETDRIAPEKIGEGNNTLVDIMAETKGIRHMIETLHDDILQLKPNRKRDTTDDISHLSGNEKIILKLAAENLIQAMISTRIDPKANTSKSHEIYSSQESNKPSKDNGKRESSPSSDHRDDQSSEEVDDMRPDRKSNHSFTLKILSNDTTQTPREHPKCVTVQTSFNVDSALPRVPNKASVTAINDNDEDEEDRDDYGKGSGQMITTSEQFEDIPVRKESNTDDLLFLKQNSTIRSNDPPDWTYYSSKPNFYPSAIQSDLPIARSDEQHSSLKQTLLSHFHRRPKLAATNISAAFTSSSLTTITNVPIVASVSAHCNELNVNASDHRRTHYTASLSQEQQRLAQKLLCDKSSFNYVCNKTLNRLKQRIFRVRKSRIIVSFDDIHQQKDAGDNDKNNFEVLVNSVVHGMSTEINRARSQSAIGLESQPKVTGGSLVSLFRSFDSAIHDGESLLFNGNSILQDDSGNEDVLSEISNSLYSVASQTILI